MAIWSDLHNSIWDQIFQLLDNLLDRIRFGAVCTQFRSVVVARQPHRLSRALLLLPSETLQLFSLSDGNVYEPTFHNSMASAVVCGSSYGWLFTVDILSGDINLLNPFSGAQISLPPLSAFTNPPELEGANLPRDIRFLEKATISSSPSESNDFIVMTVISIILSLAFCKPGDQVWTNLPTRACEDVMYYKGKFYVIANGGELVVLDLSDVDAPTETIIIQPTHEIPCKRYLAESIHGELLKICRILKRDENDNENANSYRTVGFWVCKFDGEEKWVSGGLCREAVFLGYNRAICLSTVENPECKEHGIYFTNDIQAHYSVNPNGNNEVAVYSINDGTVEEFYENHPFWTEPCVWVTPTSG